MSKIKQILIPGTVLSAIKLFLNFGDETNGKVHNGYYAKGGWPHEVLKKFLDDPTGEIKIPSLEKEIPSLEKEIPSLEKEIPSSEQENILSIYWQMLREIETHATTKERGRTKIWKAFQASKPPFKDRKYSFTAPVGIQIVIECSNDRVDPNGTWITWIGIQGVNS